MILILWLYFSKKKLQRFPIKMASYASDVIIRELKNRSVYFADRPKDVCRVAKSISRF